MAWLLMLVFSVIAACGTGADTAERSATTAPLKSENSATTTTVLTRSEASSVPRERDPSGSVQSDPVPEVGWSAAGIDERPSPVPDPTWIWVPNLGISAPIVGMGVAEDGQMEVPSNVLDVGWYEFGSSPGEPGSAVLAAHVDLAGSGPGVFFDLDALHPGNIVVITYSDGSEVSFTVEVVERVDKEDLDVGDLFARDGEPALRLVTCGGAFNPDIRRYNDNVVVTLRPDRGARS